VGGFRVSIGCCFHRRAGRVLEVRSVIPSVQHPGNPEWAAAHVAGLPGRWKKRLFNRWEKTRSSGEVGSEANRAAAYELLGTLDQLKTVNIPLDASDADICERAEVNARYCNSLAEIFHDKESLRGAMAHVCASNHISAPTSKKITDSGAIARMVDALWWRRQLRKLHAKAVEGGAISIGYVNKTRDIYVSNETLARRTGQKKRNADMMENTRARNEEGQEYTLAELAATGVSDGTIKRNELMTRISGFEVIAKDCSHEGLFFTATCPSRMHKWRTINGGRVVENRKYDGTLPDAAQAHLGSVGARFRSKLARHGVTLYGFRIAEPNHDGTPHWHWLVFFDKRWPGLEERAAYPRVCAIVRRYALGKGEIKQPLVKDLMRPHRAAGMKVKDARLAAGDDLHQWRVCDRQRQNAETGAKQHRVDFEKIDWSKGSAAAYIAKYVSKNIDGYKVETDLFGNPMFSVSRRVEAWASSWRIRQFQQVGGAPVTPWRELRRVKALPENAPDHLVQAFDACNRIEKEDEVKPAAWSEYQRAQGGVFCGRDYRIKVAKEEQSGTGRYGDPLGLRPVGVETVGEITVRDGICIYQKTINCLVKSARHVWEIIRREGVDLNRRAAAAWTRVNNCTRENFVDLQTAFKNVTAIYGPMQIVHLAEFCGPVNWPEIEKAAKGK
jgi:hypothetical protein